MVSLYESSLTELAVSMNEELLDYTLKSTTPSTCLDVVWKILCISDKTQEFHFADDIGYRSPSISRGQALAQMNHNSLDFTLPLSDTIKSVRAHEEFAEVQQIQFVDNFNFCDHFNLDLFFKLIEAPGGRNKLYTIFQVCIQIKGFKFPKQLAEKWIESKEYLFFCDDSNVFRYIEQGLKLGIFLGDAGWLDDSALVLSHVYEVITTKWNCADLNLKLTKTIQCLTKWLLVVSNSYNFDKAKDVVKFVLNTISYLENIEDRTLCIAYAYVAVSQYYYVLMEYNEAWSWAVKAVNELRENSCNILKLLVVSHTIRVSSVLNKLSTGKKLIDQLHSYEKDIDQNVQVDMILNKAWFKLKADLAQDSIHGYYAALDCRRNLFGYFNFHTATVFVEYAYARYVCDYSTTDFSEAMSCILQGIFIMNKIGLPKDNMFLMSAGRIKALILEEKAIDLLETHFPVYSRIYVVNAGQVKQEIKRNKKNMLDEAQNLQEYGLKVSLKTVGENALVTARSYSNLGRLYQSQGKYKLSEKMHLKAIKIKEKILGKDDPEVALSLGHLASLYAYQLKRFNEAEKLYLRSKAIYKATYGEQYTGVLYDYQGLTVVYRELENTEKYNEYVDKSRNFHATREAWLHQQVHTAHDANCTKDNFSVEKFKCILNECGCEKL